MLNGNLRMITLGILVPNEKDLLLSKISGFIQNLNLENKCELDASKLY